MATSPSPLTSTRAIAKDRRAKLFLWLALVSYLCVAAIVPPGHMATALASGTAFHLCPGDLRSVQIINALTAKSHSSQDHPQDHPQDHHPHHHHQSHGDDSGHPAGASSLEPACAFATMGVAVLAAAHSDSVDSIEFYAAATLTIPTPIVGQRWLRPPTRSPTPRRLA